MQYHHEMSDKCKRDSASAASLRRGASCVPFVMSSVNTRSASAGPLRIPLSWIADGSTQKLEQAPALRPPRFNHPMASSPEKL